MVSLETSFSMYPADYDNRLLERRRQELAEKLAVPTDEFIHDLGTLALSATVLITGPEYRTPQQDTIAEITPTPSIETSRNLGSASLHNLMMHDQAPTPINNDTPLGFADRSKLPA